MKKILCAIVAIIMIASCNHNGNNSVSEQYEFRKTEVSQSKPDIFYIVSTNVATAKDENGNTMYTAELNDTDRFYYEKEMEFVENKIGQGDFNVFCPYYHQYTFESTVLPKVEFDKVYQDVTEEIQAMFETYIIKYNNGRPFILAGFSQGAMLAIELLKNMDKETYSRMGGAYIIGYKLTETDLAHPNIKAAQDAAEPRTAISFNSVLSEDGIWDFVSKGAATCINPVNWRTDNVPAELKYDGDTGTVQVDTLNNVLTVNLKPEKFHEWMAKHPVFSALPPNNLHHWDLLFYIDNIHDNAILRVANL